MGLGQGWVGRIMLSVLVKRWVLWIKIQALGGSINRLLLPFGWRFASKYIHKSTSSCLFSPLGFHGFNNSIQYQSSVISSGRSTSVASY